MKPVLLKSIRISSEVCISTKPRMLKIIKTKIHMHSIFLSLILTLSGEGVWV